MPDTGRGHMKRQYKRKTYNKRPKKSAKTNTALVKLIKQVNIKQAETKYKTLNYNWGAMTHGNIYHKDLWSNVIGLFPSQGITDGSRLGDRIVCQGIKLRAIFDIPWDRKNIKLKCFYVPYNTDQGQPEVYNNFFHNVTGESRLDPVQKKRFPGVKYLGTYQIEPERASYYTYSAGTQVPDSDEISANTGTISFTKWLPMNKNIFFSADATTIPTNIKERGAILVIPYATLNTAKDGVALSGDTILLSGKMSATVYFKDL